MFNIDKKRAFAVLLTLLAVFAFLGQNATTIDVSQITALVNTLIATILPILMVVMIIKVVTSLFKNLADAF